MGVVTKSGWQTKAINLKRFDGRMDTYSSSIYNKKLKNLKFDKAYGKYSYLEDLDFSYTLSRKEQLMICSSAKYISDNRVNRNDYNFGVKEIINRHYFVNKFKFKKKYFFIGFIFSVFKNIAILFCFKPKFFLRIIGNFNALFKIMLDLKLKFKIEYN